MIKNILLRSYIFLSGFVAGLTRLVISLALARGTPLDGYLGYGSPRVVRHPHTREPWILFTAWKDVAGQVREV